VTKRCFFANSPFFTIFTVNYLLIMSLKNLIPAFAFIIMSLTAAAQVKIGSPAGAPDPKAVLELSDTARGFLLPRLTQAQMNNITTPPNGLMVYNSSTNSTYQYYQPTAQWRPIVADSSEWFFDTSSAKLYFRRALNAGDSFYYSPNFKKFMFADTRFYRLSNGDFYNLDEGNPDRFVFKTTASRFPRPAENLNSANAYFVYEADNDSIAIANPFFANYIGLASDVSTLSSATQKPGQIVALRAFNTFAGRDTVSLLYGLQNSVTHRGKGYAEVIYGINNSVNIRDSVSTTGSIYGIQNIITYSSPLGTPRISGSVFGFFSSMSTALNGKVDGNAYGIFLGNVNATGVGSVRNWGIYTNKGASRFGDSVLVTDGSSARPRSVLDVNATSAMIIPVGTTTQRPVTVYPGMLRYNSDNATPEAYTASGWVNVKNPVIASTGLIDPPFITNNSTGNVNYGFTGAAVGNTVTISPASTLPSGIVIAWAYVSAANQVTVGFANFSGSGVDLPAQTFYIKLVQ
jgi:hypothetical protein